MGDLAARWSISKDGRSYDFTLKNGVRFHDGTLVTAEEVAQCFRNSIHRKVTGSASAYFKNIDSIEVKGDFQLTIRLKRRIAGFMHVLSEASFTIFKKQGDALIFSGPFKLLQQGPKSDSAQIDLERIRDRQRFSFREMTFDAAERDFKAGNLQVLRSYGLFHVPRVMAASSQRAIMKDERNYFFAFNTQSKRFKSKESRQSFSRQLNHTALDRLLEFNQLKPSSSFLSPSFSMGRLLPEFSLTNPTSNPPVKALNDAKPVVLTMESQELGHLLKEAMGNLQYQQVNLPKKEFIARFLKGEYDLILMGFGATLKDLDMLSGFFHSQSKYNWIRLTDPSIDQLIESSSSEALPAVRIQNASRILRLNQENSWYIPICHAPLVFAFSQHLSVNGKSGAFDLGINSSEFDLNVLDWKDR